MINFANICTLWLLFFAYCVIGYVVECTYCAILSGHFTNRGFLNGPYLPIYGSGCILGVLLFGQMTNPALIFLLGGTLCCGLEWVTSYTMEKLYHARWWDYSDKPLNFQGRFWIGGFIEFGVGIDAVVLVVNPPLMAAIQRIPQTTATVLAIATCACMAVDLVFSHQSASKMRDKIDQLVAETRERAEQLAAQTREQAQAFASEKREQVETRVAAKREQVGARVAQKREAAEALTAQYQEQAETLKAQYREQAVEFDQEQQAKAEARAEKRSALHAKLADRRAWQQALDWQFGERLRSAKDGAARAIRQDLPQAPALEEVAERFRSRLDARERRMLNAFPGMRPRGYRSLAKELADRFDSLDS